MNILFLHVIVTLQWIMQIKTYTTMLTWKFPTKVIEGTATAKRLIKILNPDSDFISPFPYADL